MARPKVPVRPTAALAEVVDLSSSSTDIIVGSSASFKRGSMPDNAQDRRQIAQPWQVEAYRQAKICGEARYSATLYANIASRAELGVAMGQSLRGTRAWVDKGPEVDVLSLIVPTVRDRTRLIRDYMIHRVIAGECYLISRKRRPTDMGYPDNRNPVWEIVGVTELRRIGGTNDNRWEVRFDNLDWIPLETDDPVIRMWVPDPENRREAWSPFRAMLTTLQEIEYLTAHIFAQVRSRLNSAGVWFLPNNLTYPQPDPDDIEGGETTLSGMNEAERLMAALATSMSESLGPDEVSIPTVIMADPEALKEIDQKKLIQFWSEIDDRAMTLRSDAIRRFALGMDLPPEQVLGSSGLAVTGAGGSAGSVNHWGVWANEEQTISSHIEPALDDLASVLTTEILQALITGTDKVIAYNTASLRLRQDRSKESIELYDRGLLKGDVALRENGFDPDADAMDDKERAVWLLTKLAGGSPTPELVHTALNLLGLPIGPPEVSGNQDQTKQISDRNQPKSLESHPYEGPPRVDHEHNDAPFSALVAASEGLVLRALEKAGNRLLNARTRGKDKDRITPPYLAHAIRGIDSAPVASDFDFGMSPVVFAGHPAAAQLRINVVLTRYCVNLYQTGEPYRRDTLIEALLEVA